jgi:hypothetical protein
MFCLASLQAKEGQLVDARDLLMRLLAIEPDKEEAVSLLGKVQKHLDASKQNPTAEVSS